MELIRFEALSRILSGQDRTNSAIDFGEDQLIELFDVLKAAIDVGDPRLIESLLDDWHAKRKPRGISSNSEVFDKIIHSIINISQERLTTGQSQQVIKDLLPI